MKLNGAKRGFTRYVDMEIGERFSLSLKKSGEVKILEGVERGRSRWSKDVADGVRTDPKICKKSIKMIG